MLKKKAFGKLNSDAGDYDLANNDYRDCNDFILIKDGASLTPRRQNVKGNSLIPSESIGTNDRTLGDYYDEKNNRVIFVNDHQDNTVGLYYYYPEDNTITKRVDSDIFNLGTIEDVSEIYVVQNYVIWKDDDDQVRQYNMDDDAPSFFTGNDKLIMLLRPQPWQSAWATRGVNTLLGVNKITSNSYQFAYQYIFEDDSESVISPLSQVNLADTTYRVYNDVTDNTIRLYIPIVSIDSLRHINLYYRRNDEDEYYLFERFNKWSDTDTTVDPVTERATTAYFFDFTGGEAASAVASEQIIKKQESIPWKTKSIVFAQNRLFMTRQVVNQEIDNLNNFIFTAYAVDILNSRDMYCMPGASYTVGIEFFNKEMNSTTVVKTDDVNVPEIYSNNLEYIEKTASYQIRVRLSGTPPTNFDYYRILMTKNQKYIQWCQVSVHMLFFKEDYLFGVSEPGTKEFRDGSSIYYLADNLPNLDPIDDQITKIHLQLPVNMPFDIEPSKHRVRIISDFFSSSNHGAATFSDEAIHEIRGDKIVVGNFGIKDWTWLNYVAPGRPSLSIPILMEIFVPTETVDGTFFEVGREFRIIEQGGNRVFEKTDITLEGDVRFFEERPETNAFWVFRWIKSAFHSNRSEYSKMDGFQQSLTTTKKPPPEFLSKVLIDIWGIVGVLRNEGDDIYTHDYSKLASNRGRPNIDADYIQINAGHSIAFSRPLLTNTGLNGLNNVDSDAYQDLDSEFGEVNKLVSLHDNLMLAIHARSVTSMYIGERYLKQADSRDISVITDKVISHHRSQQGAYGTINPESVVVADGKAYWWDALRGCIAGYDNNGIDELSKLAEMKTFFREISDIIKPYRDSHAVIGEYHEFHDLIIWTFKPILVDGNTIFAGVTIAYHVTGKYFLTKFRFIAERYGRIPQGIVSFKNGKLYRHDANSNYCNFYGVQYTPNMTLLLNDLPSVDKMFENINLDANVKLLLQLTAGDMYTEIDKVDYVERHNSLYADVMRDMNTPNKINPKFTGDNVLGQIATLVIMPHDEDRASYVEINEISYGYQILQGQEIENKTEK